MGPSPATCHVSHESVAARAAPPAGRNRPILQDRPRFKNSHRPATACRIMIDKGWQFVIGIDPAELDAQLIALENVIRDNAILKAGFLQHDGYLLPVGRR
jgi:hypothetical protein